MVRAIVSTVQSDQGHVRRPRIQAVRRFVRCDRGVSSVEFVLILPLLMLFLFSIIAFASTLYVQVNMENAAREAARRLAVADFTQCIGGVCTGATVDCDATTPGGTRAEDYACTYLVNWAIDFEVEVFQGSCPGDRDVIVTVRLPNASEAALTDIFGFFDGRTLTAEVVMREEESCV